MSKAVPNGWHVRELGDITEKIEGGGTPTRSEPSYWSGNIPWVTVKDLKKVRLSFAEESISELGLKESSSRLIPKNTLIIATRMALGKAVMFDRDVTINQDLKAVFPKKEMDSEYLLQWYLSKSEYIQSMGTGSTVKGIRLDDLRLIPISLPPLPEQQKIASILTAVDDVIESTQAQINKLKDLKTGMMQELLTKGIGHTEFKDSPVGRIPKAWEVVGFKDVFKEYKYGPRFSSKDYDLNGNVKTIRGTDVSSSGHINYRQVPTANIDQSTVDAHALKDGDLVMITTADCGLTAVFYEQNIPYIASAYAIKLTPSDKINSQFAVYFMQTANAKTQVESFIRKGTVANLPGSDVMTLLIALPSINEQGQIVSTLSALDGQISLKLHAMELQGNLKKALMQDLLTGKVRVKIN